MTLLLIGFMASGKTSFGSFLAKKLAYQFVDLDEEIVKSQECSIGEIFKEKGEAYFRKLEKKKLRKFLKLEKIVIASGGGVALNKGNCSLIKRSPCLTIFLETDAKSVLKFTKNNNSRPLLENKTEKEIEKMIKTREAFYTSLANLKLNLNNLSFNQALVLVKQEMKNIY